MKIRVVLSVEIDPDEWHQLNGTDRASIRDDVRSYVLTSVRGAAMIEDCSGEVSLAN